MHDSCPVQTVRAISKKSGSEARDRARGRGEFVCCGFPVKASDLKSAMVLGAYNIALAEKRGLDLCALCSSCTSALTEVVHHLAHDDQAKSEVNEALARAGLHYDKGVRVRHFARCSMKKSGKMKSRSTSQRA